MLGRLTAFLHCCVRENIGDFSGGQLYFTVTTGGSSLISGRTIGETV